MYLVYYIRLEPEFSLRYTKHLANVLTFSK